MTWVTLHPGILGDLQVRGDVRFNKRLAHGASLCADEAHRMSSIAVDGLAIANLCETP
jgi:hypothetical protein